ncbi:uncharacterized protein [Mytilus edulis]|uniref:uncharacterized protein n=1 Tax=Mytilus edulis TaxID=6550 RepID=UPI0039F110FF
MAGIEDNTNSASSTTSEMINTADIDKRLRTLTESGKELFENKQRKFLLKMQIVKSDLQLLARNIEPYSNELTSLQELKTEFMSGTVRYDTICKEYLDFLSRTNTAEGMDEVHKLSGEMQDFTQFVETESKRMNTFINELRAIERENSLASRSSRRSHSSRKTHSSSSSSVLARARAKAEAAKVKVHFAEKETLLLKEKALIEEKRSIESAKVERKKADIEADLDLLSRQKEAAAVEAEANALQNECDENMSQVLPDQPPLDSKSKTAAYINHVQKQISSIEIDKENTDAFHIDKENKHSTHIDQENTHVSGTLDPHANSFIPRKNIIADTHVSDNHPYPSDRTLATDFTRFLLKRDLLMSRFNIFNDKPEYYPSWKDSFKKIVKEIDADSSEEIDLLLKWTGPSSKTQVQSIKAANTNNPSRALKLIWERLNERYGSPELIDSALKTKLAAFPRITNKDYFKLYDLSDILSEISSVKENDNYKVIFSYFDSSVGVTPIVAKLPYQLQERWTTMAVNYNDKNKTIYPPFHVFAQFIQQQSKVKNNPSFLYDSQQANTGFKDKLPTTKGKLNDVRTRKTDFAETKNERSQSVDPREKCLIHGTNHTLNDCRTFKSKPIQERRQFLKLNKLCFGCCLSASHFKRNCPNAIKCGECGKTDHPTALHIKNRDQQSTEPSGHGGEPVDVEHEVQTPIQSACTQICMDKFGGKSCAKIIPVEVYRSDNPDRRLKVYALMDDQSNRTLGKSELFDYFGSTSVSDFTLSTCSGKSQASGRKLSGLVVESLDKQTQLHVPDILECNLIPDSKDEIPTQEVVLFHNHLSDLVEFIEPLDEESEILLLIGRDLISAHHVLDQRIESGNAPYAQKLPLGWTVIGETCLGKLHYPDETRVKKTYLLSSDRISIFPPCTSELKIDEVRTLEVNESAYDNIGKDVFIRRPDDDKPGLSRDDRKFIESMDTNFWKDSRGNWSAPLPFRQDRQVLPNNRNLAWKRAKGLDANLRKDLQKREHFFTFMNTSLEKGHAEKAPHINDDQEQWYLPIFGVYHPKKPGKLRAVFDSSAQFDGVSLNNVLLSGPDLTNNLIGVLLRFRREQVAIMGDIEQMFYSFKVDEKHRDYLRFFWYTDNDFDKPLTVYRMCVHVFGNSPSPAIASYGLRKTAMEGENEFGSDMLDFVTRDFYVDDGLTSKPSSAEAIDLMKRTKSALKSIGNIRLHKISSNVEEVMHSFDNEDLAKSLKDLDLSSDILPIQHSLGMNWDLETDTFMYYIDRDVKPYTRRGLLSTINSIFDPLGYLAPVTIKGKLLLRSVMTGQIMWDEPLPEEVYNEWESWRTSLFDLETVKFKRMFVPTSFTLAKTRKIHIYSDASEKAIAAVGYIQLDDDKNFGFIMGKAKVAPSHSHTIPRLELCGALLATEIGQTISDQLDIPLSDIHYYTDSKVVLGYIFNSSRRFYNYVSNRVAKIHTVSNSEQWSYVHTDGNPADLATRSIIPSKLENSIWLSGPVIKKDADQTIERFSLINPDTDNEIRPDITTRKTTSLEKLSLGSQRFERFGNWKSLVRSIALIKNFLVNKISKETRCRFRDAEMFVVGVVQNEIFSDEIDCIKNGRPLRGNSALLQLSPFIDNEGILRVGGRIKMANVQPDERNPILIPSKHWIATLIIRYFHQKIKHQGRQFTSGAIRTGGYWIVGEKRLVSSIIYKCITCRKLRGHTEQQKMADLPEDRVIPETPFTSIGIDTFGPWSVISRRTRGGVANAKRWAIIFTCLVTRGVHLEVVEEMTSSSFINAFKRFIAIRGEVKLIRSDRGTNFVGATDQLGIDSINVEDGPIKEHLYDNGIEWHFNSPHSSHMGGIWERMIKTTRSILDSMLSELPGKELSHEVLVTLLAEVSAIINSRPLTCVPTDSDEPLPLTPNLIITQKPSVLIPKDVSFDCKDMYYAQWKRVQYLSNVFWKRWRVEYLQTLQCRQKWTQERENIQEGDVVLLKDNQVNRLSWPMGIVTKTFPSADNLVRKVEIRIVRTVDKDCVKPAFFVRPVTELVLLSRTYE